MTPCRLAHPQQDAWARDRELNLNSRPQPSGGVRRGGGLSRSRISRPLAARGLLDRRSIHPCAAWALGQIVELARGQSLRVCPSRLLRYTNENRFAAPATQPGP